MAAVEYKYMGRQMWINQRWQFSFPILQSLPQTAYHSPFSIIPARLKVAFTLVGVQAWVPMYGL